MLNFRGVFNQTVRLFFFSMSYMIEPTCLWIFEPTWLFILRCCSVWVRENLLEHRNSWVAWQLEFSVLIFWEFSHYNSKIQRFNEYGHLIIRFFSVGGENFFRITPPKTNMSPKRIGNTSSNHHFSGAMLVSGSVHHPTFRLQPIAFWGVPIATSHAKLQPHVAARHGWIHWGHFPGTDGFIGDTDGFIGGTWKGWYNFNDIQLTKTFEGFIHANILGSKVR